MRLDKQKRYLIMNRNFPKDILFPQKLYKITGKTIIGIKNQIQKKVRKTFQEYNSNIKIGIRSVMSESTLGQDPVELPFEKKHIQESLNHYSSLFRKKNGESELFKLSAILLNTLPKRYGVDKSTHCAGKLMIIMPASIKRPDNIRINLEILPNEFFTRNIEFAESRDLIRIEEDFGRSLNITGCVDKISVSLLKDILHNFYTFLDRKYHFKSSLWEIYKQGGEIIDFTISHDHKKISHIYLFDF
jgi:hypothetical protein